MRMKRFCNVMTVTLLLATGSLAAQQPVPLDEEPAVDQEVPAEPELPLFEEPPAESEIPAQEEFPEEQGEPMEPELIDESPAVPETPVQPPKPAVRKPKPAVQAARAESFRVRVATVGRGFGGGASGQLRISGTGISFTREGQTREDWMIRWSDLAEAGKDGGLWDAPHPLVLKEHGGQKRFVAYIDPKGRYLSGQPVIDAIAKKRRIGG